MVGLHHQTAAQYKKVPNWLESVVVSESNFIQKRLPIPQLHVVVVLESLFLLQILHILWQETKSMTYNSFMLTLYSMCINSV